MAGTYIAPTEIINPGSVNSLGAGLKLVKEEITTFDKVKAEWLLNNTTVFSSDRQLKNRHVDYLVSQMQRGDFRPEFTTIITCNCNGKTYRMNGQHTAWAVIHTNNKAPYGFKCKHLHYKAGNEHDMRQLYTTIDRNSPRTKYDVVSSLLFETPQFAGYTKKNIHMACTGLGFHLYGHLATEAARHARSDTSALVELLLTEYYETTTKILSFFESFNQNFYTHVLRMGPMGAMYATWDKAIRDSEDFWSKVITGEMMKRTHPAMQLRQLLQSHNILNRDNGAPKRHINAETMYRASLHCWNHFRDGETLEVLLYGRLKTRPKVK